MQPKDLPEYSFPNLSAVERLYVVVDDRGRVGIAKADPCYHKDVLFAHPTNVAPQIETDMPGICGAVLMTDTAFSLRPDGIYTGLWYDYDGPSHVPDDQLRRLTIVDDLGWRLPDWIAEKWLAGSDQMGFWDHYTAQALGRKGGSSTSEAKRQASAENGKRGGRPRKTTQRRITLTRRQIQAFRNQEWASPDDDVDVICDLPSKNDPNPSVEYVINGESHDSQERWKDLPQVWRTALRKA